jgi:predicted GIY-YIG superfamily endonuclease
MHQARLRLPTIADNHMRAMMAEKQMKTWFEEKLENLVLLEKSEELRHRGFFCLQ